ncbi:Glycoside hydrolase family 81 protein [Mycena venus]|uniref:Glycoside hydrolase family 81 protein n=1 Tax=Mycena venus TaxID=2733690 RepID=A0A8H6YVB5_9AGAR|nr:Glycoside hydrolase family 81 protein [Mycena venus]
MQFTLLLPLFVAALGQLGHGAPAVDDRLLVQIPSVDGMSAFTDAWADVCTLWPPFNTNGLPNPGMSLVSSLVEPGDFSGNNADTEAKVVCTWTDGTKLIPITPDVANFIGATLL